MGLRSWLGLKKDPLSHRALQRWPSSVADDRRVTFAIALKSARSTDDWETTQKLLSATLRSVFRQTDQRFRIIICGHELPSIPEIADDRIEFISALWDPPTDGPSFFRRDRYRKRFLMGKRLRELGGGFTMDLDADDLVHRDLVSTALASDFGCLATKGFIYDFTNGRLAPIPGALSVDLDRLCGSTAIVKYDSEDFAEQWKSTDGDTSPFDQARQHAYIRTSQEERRRPLAPIPYPAVIYVINTKQNLSFAKTRRDKRGIGMISLIEEHEIKEPAALAEIDDKFGALPSP